MSRETLTQIIHVKRDLLYQVFKPLYWLLAIDPIIKRYLKESKSDFKNFLEPFIQSVNTTHPLLPDSSSYPQELIQAARLSMRRQDYEPPSEYAHKLYHLIIMWELYGETHSWPPDEGDLFLDLSFAKLLADAHREITDKTFRADSQYSKTRKLLANRTAGKEEKKDIVLKRYAWVKQIHPNLSFHATVKKIREEMEGEPHNFRLPSWKTIERYLKEAGIK